MLHDTKHDLSQDSRDLLNAADYIDQNGWCQRTKVNLDGEVCLFGSILAVTDGLAYDYHTSSRARELYETLSSIVGMPAATWNDQVAKTKDEVTALLREVALKSKE